MKIFLQFFTKITKAGYFLAFIALLTRIGLFMSLPFLAVYLTRQGIFTSGEIGIVIGVSGLVFSITSLFNGMYVDRNSSRVILIVSLVMSGFCYFGLALTMRHFFLLAFINATLGWLRSLSDISSLSVVVNNTTKEYLSYAYSARFIAINLGLVFGPLIGAVMANQQSLYIFYIAGAIHICVGVGIIFANKDFFKKSIQEQPGNILKNFNRLYKDNLLLNITLINFLMWVAYSQLDSTIPQYVTHFVANPAILVSKMMVINAIVCVLFQPVVSRWAENHSIRHSGVIGCLLFSITFLTISFYPSSGTILLAAGLLSFGELFTLPINSILVMRTSPKHLVASYTGLSNLGLLGLSVGPILGGYGLQYIGAKYLFLLISLLPVIVGWRYWTRVPD